MYSSLSTLSVPGHSVLPQLLPAAGLWGAASFVVYACQRLAENASMSVDRASRKVSDSLASVGIGCIVWALDFVACALRDDMPLHGWPLLPSLAALLVVILTCRLTVPALISRNSWRSALLAGIGMASGVVLAHMMIVTGYFAIATAIDVPVLLLAFGLMVGLIVHRSWRYRGIRLRAGQAMHQNAWCEWLACGGVIVLVHGLLSSAFVRMADGGSADLSEVHRAWVPVMVGMFAGAMALEQYLNMRSDRGRQHFFHQGLSLMRADGARLPPQAEARLALIADHLDQLICPRKLVLHFQPIADLHSHALHLEALLRLEHKGLGRINPEHFFLACELRGKTCRVDRLILANALNHAQAWHAQGVLVPIHVNLAPSTLLQEGFVEWLGAELARRALPARHLRLELTEHAIIESAQAMSGVVDRLLGIGVQVLMDDFGSGYSSLGLLADLKIAGIKCDRSMVRNLAHDVRRQTLLRHVAAMARDLQLQVTVEGVEDAVELRLAARAGIGSIQGYLFARPMAAADVAHWLEQEAPARLRAMGRVLQAQQPRAAAQRIYGTAH